MAPESSNTYELNPQAQMGIFWRILHLITSRYGNYPMGQTLVALTMVFLNERGMPPTLTDLCEATGLPKASVSRYVSWQLREGLCEEHLDPKDRRRRLLVQTNKGQEEWDWQLRELGKVFNEVAGMHVDLAESHTGMSAGNLLDLMKELTKMAPKQRVRSGLVKKK
jgi:DNA-binding MarR family transcriptional regulator